MNNETLKTIRIRVHGFRADLKSLGAPEVVAALIVQVREFARSGINLIDGLKGGVSAGYCDDFGKWNGAKPPINTPSDNSSWGWVVRAGAFAAVLLECCFAGILAALTFNLPALPAVLAGILITVVITLVFKGVWRILAARDENRPRKGVHSLTLQLVAVFPAWVLTLTGAFLIGRTLTEATPLANVVFSFLMTILTVLSPVLAAILLTYSELHGWARKHVQDWQALEKLELEIHELEEHCDAVEKGLSGEPQKTLRGPNDGGVARSLAATAAVLLCSFVFSPALKASDCHNQIWVDSSPSPSPLEMQTAINSSFALLTRLGESDCGQQWDLLGFAGAAFSATPFHTVALPHRPTDACQVQVPSSEMGMLFRKMAEKAEAERKRMCNEARQRADMTYHAAVDEELKKAHEALARFTVPDPNRTCIVDLLERLSDTSDTLGRSLILSDGEETCQPGFSGPIPAPRTNVVVAMVIVSEKSETETPGQHYSRMKQTWQKIAPWVDVVPIYGIQETILELEPSSVVASLSPGGTVKSPQ